MAVGGAEFNTRVVCADHHGSSEHRVPGNACEPALLPARQHLFRLAPLPAPLVASARYEVSVHDTLPLAICWILTSILVHIRLLFVIQLLVFRNNGCYCIQRIPQILNLVDVWTCSHVLHKMVH